MAARSLVYAFDPEPSSMHDEPSWQGWPELSSETNREFINAGSDSTFASGRILFREGESASGCFIVKSGAVKMTVDSAEGRSLILRIAGPGDILELGSAVLGEPHDTTAEVLQEVELSLIRRPELLRLCARHNDLALWLAKELSREYHGLCEEIGRLGLQRSAMARLAQLLVEWAEKAPANGAQREIACVLTHEQIGQIIGTSRETVTRLLHSLKAGNIANLRRESLV